MVSELGECIPCFADNRGRFGAIGSDLGNGMRKYVKAKKDFNISYASASLEYVCIKLKPDIHTRYIQIYKIHTFIHIYTNACMHDHILTYKRQVLLVLYVHNGIILHVVYRSPCCRHHVKVPPEDSDTGSVCTTSGPLTRTAASFIRSFKHRSNVTPAICRVCYQACDQRQDVVTYILH